MEEKKESRNEKQVKINPQGWLPASEIALEQNTNTVYRLFLSSAHKILAQYAGLAFPFYPSFIIYDIDHSSSLRFCATDLLHQDIIC